MGSHTSPERTAAHIMSPSTFNSKDPALTVWSIVEGQRPITLVCRDDDGGWQFLDTAAGRKPRADEAALIAIDELLEIDPSLVEVADLPPGWTATRPGIGRPWLRTRTRTGLRAWLRSFIKPAGSFKPSAVLKPVAAIPATEAERALVAVSNAITSSPAATTAAQAASSM